MYQGYVSLCLYHTYSCELITRLWALIKAFLSILEAYTCLINRHNALIINNKHIIAHFFDNLTQFACLLKQTDL